jgi:hypothetical protein
LAARTAAYVALDHDLRLSAPMIVLGNFMDWSYFAPRVGCVVDQPVYGVDFAALCLP